MRELPGNWMNGMTSKMLTKKMKKNSDVRKGMNRRPSGPMVCMTMFCSTKLTPPSATCCTPLGTSARLRAARPKVTTVRIIPTR